MLGSLVVSVESRAELVPILLEQPAGLHPSWGVLTELSCLYIFGRLFGQGTKHREGAWRAWRLSGALLEFSAWSSRQSPCLQHHLSSSARTEQDTLAQLQQQLHVRRKARQAAVEEERRRRKRSRGQDSSGDDSADAAGYDYGQRPGGYSGCSWQGCALWGCVLVVVAGWCVGRKGVLLLAPVVAAGAAVYCISSGVLLPNEAAVQQLARVFDEDGSAAILVRVTLGVGGPVLCCAALADKASNTPSLLSGCGDKPHGAPARVCMCVSTHACDAQSPNLDEAAVPVRLVWLRSSAHV